MIRSQLRSATVVLVLLATRSAAAAAQSDPLSAARIAMLDYDAVAARPALEAALAGNPASYEANWRMAITLMDLGNQVTDPDRIAGRDSLYAQAENYARRAVAAKSDGANGHFALAAILGRRALTSGMHQRIRLAGEIRSEAQRAVALDPRHDGAWHVLGLWNAEVERLSAFDRFMARHLLGGGVLGSASWSEAEADLRRAVDLAPQRILHRLDLAEVQADRHEWGAAAAQLDTLGRLPVREPLDPVYLARAHKLAQRVAAQRDR